MDLPIFPTICLSLIVTFLVTYWYTFGKRVTSMINWSPFETLPWILLNLNRLYRVTSGLLKRHNGTFILKGTWFGVNDFLTTVDPANIHYITTTNFANYPKGPEFRKVFSVMGDVTFTLDDDEWKLHRRITHPLVKSRSSFVTYAIKTTRNQLEQGLVPLLKHASKCDLIVDMQDVFIRFTMDVACKSLTGHDPKSLSIDFPDMPVLKAVTVLEEAILYRVAFPEIIWKLQLWFRFGPEYKLKQAEKILGSYIHNIVSKKRKELNNNITKLEFLEKNDKGIDLLTSLATDFTKNLGVDINSDKFFRDITMQLLLAGRDTISSALTWFIWLMIKHPEVEEKIREELIANLTDSKDEKWHVFHADEIDKLVYLNAALRESLRLYPPGPFQYKSPVQPDILPTGHHIRPTTKIIIPLYSMARMKSIWGDDCSKFRPERWISEQGNIKHEPSYKFFVFYAGPRTCMGRDMAMTQMKMIIATLIHNLQFQIVDGHDCRPDVSIILRMTQGLKVNVRNRWTSK